jgi:hypothetical protein
MCLYKITTFSPYGRQFTFVSGGQGTMLSGLLLTTPS